MMSGEPRIPQRLSHGGPDCPVVGDVAGAVGADLDNVQAATSDARAHGGAEGGPVLGVGVVCAVERSQGREVQAVGRAKQRLELVSLAGLGQEGEDPAAVVVDQDDGGVQTVKLRGQQPVRVVIEREVAGDEDDRPETTGSQAEGCAP